MRTVAKLFRSRVGRRWARGLSFEARADLVREAWRACNTGLDYREKLELACHLYDDRRLWVYPLDSSLAYSRVFGLFDVVREVRDTPGAVVECGVGNGRSLAAFVYAVAFFGLDKPVFGFDSFAGFPPAAPQDVGPRVAEAGAVPEGWSYTTPEMIEDLFARDRLASDSVLSGTDTEVHVIPGFFDDTLHSHLPPEIALLHVDCDLYGSTKTVLEEALPRVSPGGIVLLDEYRDERWPGATTAVDEACQAHGLQPEWLESASRHIIRIPEHDAS